MAEIVHLTSAHPPRDPRIHYRECMSLERAGHSVTEIVPCGMEEEGVLDGIRIRTLSPPSGRVERMTRTTWEVYRSAKKLGADLYHLHDPELLPVGLLLRAAGGDVVYDIHEDAARQMLDKEWLRYDSVRRLAANLVTGLEQLAPELLSGVVAASPEIADRFPADRTALVRNFVRLEMVDATAPLGKTSERAVAVYPGSLTEARGIREIVAAMHHLEGRVELWLMGSWSTPDLAEACRASPGWRHTRYLGRLGQEEVFGRLKSADIGLHTPYPLGSYSSGLAMKGFEYMACRLPMVMTDEPAKRKTFGECALFADAQDSASIADRIRKLLDQPEQARRLGQRGRELVEERYSWEREATKLIQLYERIL